MNLTLDAHPLPSSAQPGGLSALPTPALVLSKPKLEANLERMAARLQKHDVRLRPHMKTAKSVDVARLATRSQFGGITVSTVDEAEYFAQNGFRDILYAVGVVPAKLDRLATLVRSGVRVSLVLDCVTAARSVARRAADLQVSFPVSIEIDSDGHRSGVLPDSDQLIEIAEVLDRASSTCLAGVLTHAGESYNCRSTQEIGEIAERERAAVVRAAERLRGEGLEVAQVSVGSTPTATFATRLDGVTEVRVGVYMLQDLVMTGLGACTIDDIAISVLATVLGHSSDGTRVIVDAGWMALSRDRGTERQERDQGYGVVCDLDGRPFDDLIVAAANQEHGLIERRDRSRFAQDDFPIGSLVRVLPNHACATAAAHSGFHVVDERNELVGYWPRGGSR